MSIHIVARFVARPDSTEALRSILMDVVEPTRKEPGCIHYALINNRVDPAEFLFVEEWANQEAINAHMKAPHLKELVMSTKALLATPLEVQFYNAC